MNYLTSKWPFDLTYLNVRSKSMLLKIVVVAWDYLGRYFLLFTLFFSKIINAKRCDIRIIWNWNQWVRHVDIFVVKMCKGILPNLRAFEAHIIMSTFPCWIRSTSAAPVTSLRQRPILGGQCRMQQLRSRKSMQFIARNYHLDLPTFRNKCIEAHAFKNTKSPRTLCPL